ncbi:hypothetical protein MBLNU13_g00218t2 [Cladosporium sp. NU13]
MHFTTLTAAAVAAFAASSHAVSSQFVLNNCTESIYITNINSTKSTTGPFEVKGSGGNWTTEVIGVGNSLGISKTDKYWTPETPKFILGTSTDAGILYWTVSNVDGDPLRNQTFELSSGPGNVCDNATT